MLPIQCKLARVALGLGVRDLAARAEKSPNTVARFERGEGLRSDTVAAIRRVFEESGIAFIAENGGGPGVRFAKRQSRVQPARRDKL